MAACSNGAEQYDRACQGCQPNSAARTQRIGACVAPHRTLLHSTPINKTECVKAAVRSACLYIIATAIFYLSDDHVTLSGVKGHSDLLVTLQKCCSSNI